MKLTNYEKAVQIYERGGYSAVFDAVERNELKADAFRDCIPCEMRTPHEDNACLVCGSPSQDSGSKALTHDIKFDDVDSMVLWLLENDIDNIPVTLRIHLEQS